MTARRDRRFAALTATLLCLGVCAGSLPSSSAAAAPGTSLRLISGPDPLPAAGTAGACGSSAEFQGWEQEPTLAVDPGDDSHLVAAWMQDYSDAIVTASSRDGGRTWTTTVPKTTGCTGGGAEYAANSSAIDPALSFGPADPVTGKRTVYLTAVLSTPSAPAPPIYALVVHHSTDGGRTWSDAVTVARVAMPLYLDGTTIVADPIHPGRAYVAWRQGDGDIGTDHQVLAGSRQQFVSRTDDAGASWTPGLPIPTDGFQLSGHLHVLSDGALLNVMSSIPDPAPGTARRDITGPTTLLAVRSVDLGTTWSSPVEIAVADETHLTNLGSFVGPDGSVYVTWQRATSGSYSIMLARSSTGGRSWSAPTVVASEPGDPLLQLFATPDIAVRGDGTVGIGFYDHRNATADTPGVSDYWFRTSRNGAGPWNEQHVAGPFDVTAAPLGFLGDFQGVVPLGKRFGLAIALTGQPVTTPPTDIVWTTVR